MLRKLLATFLVLLLLAASYGREAQADDCAGLPEGSNEKVTCYENKIKESQGQQKTLASTISYLDNKIALTRSEVEQTTIEISRLEKDVATLSVKIGRLDESLTDVSKLLVHRVGAIYKRSYIKPFYLFFSSGGFSEFFEKNKYLKVAQQNDKKLLLEMQESKDTFEAQKDLKEVKQEELEEKRALLDQQKAALGGQIQSKQKLLSVTQNDERKYQSLLATARAEMAAIRSILAGYGKEEEKGQVNEGSKIATIIPGSSTCSTGAHLHFEVSNNKVNANPASYLKSKDVDWDLCGWWPDCDSSFAFLGSWNWPINGKPRITQGFGMTGYAKTGAYSGGQHTGIDMISSDLTVKAVKTGTLYQGSIACGGGTLTYAKMKHQDSNIDTYYLHVY